MISGPLNSPLPGSRAASRRGFLRQMLGASWTGAVLMEQSVFRAAQARAQSASAPNSLFKIEKIADGIYAAISKPASLINCNAAIFVNSNDILIVDTHSKPSAASALVAQIRKEITTKPVGYIVNSHFHWDHSQGNGAYHKIAPRANLVASTATRKLLSENGAQRLKESVDTARQTLEEMKKQAGSATDSTKKGYFQQSVKDIESYIREMSGYQPELPNLTFDKSLVLHDAAHELHLHFLGRAHTAGDVFVFCPQKKAIATGDAMHGFLPYMGDCYPKEWPNTLTRLADLPFEHILPGHGDPQHGKNRIYDMSAYILEVTEAVAVGKKAGKSAQQLVREITPAKLKTLERNGYGTFVSKSLDNHFDHAPGQDPATAVAAGVQGNIEHTYVAIDRA